MDDISSGSRKRSLAQAVEDEDESSIRIYGRRQRNPSRRQQQIDEDEAAKMEAKLERRKKASAKQRWTVAEHQDEDSANDDDDEIDEIMESQDEGDLGHGARPGGGFTSVISSRGSVPHSRSIAQKKQLVLETDRSRDESEHLHPFEDDLLDVNEDMLPLDLRLQSPRPNSNRSFSSLPPSPHEHTAPPPPPRHRRHERITPSSRSEVNSISLPPPPRHSGATSSRRTTPLSTRSEVNRTSLPPPPKHMRPPPAPFRQEYKPGPKPKAADYDEHVEKMLLNAMHEYACLVLSADAFPHEMKQTQWAEATWRAACEDVGVQYECSVRMIRLITGRGSWARGFLKDAVRNNFKVFKFKEGSTEEIKRYNQELRSSLLRDDAFHHKNQEEVTGFGEHHVVLDILRDALFEDSKSYGVKYSRHFNPISVNLLALVFTMIEFLLNEWSTGVRKKSTFRSSTYLETFNTHYLRTEQWCDLDQTVTTNIRKRMFRTLMKKAGASHKLNAEGGSGPTGMTTSMKERAKEALAGRTGDTDDEDN